MFGRYLETSENRATSLALNLTPNLLIADRFRLISLLGQGGMGAVWLAHHTGLGIPCAVKFIHPQAAQDPENRARFEREAHAVAQIRSPHVVQIFDHGIWQSVPYIAMEYLQGEDLASRLRHRRAITPAETFAILSQIGHALAKAHAVGIVHRDLKPANIFLVRDDDQEIAKVLDFGIAKDTKPGLDMRTQTGATLGTPFYMSPEQGRGLKNLDHRSDLWALGVIAYRCLTGQLPFTGDVLGDLLMKIMVDPIPLPSSVAQVPRGFDAWWLRAVARDPAQRFQSIKELTDALGVALDLTQPGHANTARSMPSLSGAVPAASAVTWSPSVPHQEGTPPVTPNLTSGPMPTPLQHAVTAQQSARPSRAVPAVAAAVGVLSLGGLAAFFALRGGSTAPTTAAPEVTPAQTASPTVPSAPAETSTTAPGAAVDSTAAPVPEPVIAASSSSAPPPRPTSAPIEARSAAVDSTKPPAARPTAAATTKPIVPPPPVKVKKHEGIY